MVVLDVPARLVARDFCGHEWVVFVQLEQPGVVTVPGVILSEAKAFAVQEFQASYASVLLLDVFCSEGHEIHLTRFTIANKKPPLVQGRLALPLPL